MPSVQAYCTYERSWPLGNSLEKVSPAKKHGCRFIYGHVRSQFPRQFVNINIHTHARTDTYMELCILLSIVPKTTKTNEN